MPGQIRKMMGLISLVPALFVSDIGVGAPIRSDQGGDCLTAPNPTLHESHWYYRLDKANERKCWYSRALGQLAQQEVVPAPPATPPQSQPIPSGSAFESGNALTPIPSDAGVPSLSHVKTPNGNASTLGETVDELTPRGGSEGNTLPSISGASATPDGVLSQTFSRPEGAALDAAARRPIAPRALSSGTSKRRFAIASDGRLGLGGPNCTSEPRAAIRPRRPV
jgi:hypothetical protein